MDVKVKLLREDGETTIWCKFFDKDGNLTNKEFTITYEEWDAIKKTRLEKNIWMLDIQKTEQDERIEWLLEPSRMFFILQALSGNNQPFNAKDMPFVLALGNILSEYQEKFNLSPFDFLSDAKMAKEIFQFSLDMLDVSEGE